MDAMHGHLPYCFDVIVLRLPNCIKHGPSRRWAYQCSVAQHYWGAGWHAVFFYVRQLLDVSAFGMRLERKCFARAIASLIFQPQPDANDTSQDAPGCMIPSLLSLYLCHQQWLGPWDGTFTSPSLHGNVHQTSVSWRWKFCWFPGTSGQRCSMTAYHNIMTIALHCTMVSFLKWHYYMNYLLLMWYGKQYK